VDWLERPNKTARVAIGAQWQSHWIQCDALRAIFRNEEVGPERSGLELEPDDFRWTFADRVACGIRAYQRPCHTLPDAGRADGGFPSNPVCSTSREIVFIIEDDEGLRAELIEMVEEMGYAAIGCATPSEFERNRALADSGCVLLDIRLPGGDGVSILERLKDSFSVLTAIMLTGLSDPVVVANCMKIGALEYIVKPASEMTLRRAIERAVGQSRSNYCREQSRQLIRTMLARLTPTERTIAEMLARGLSTKLVAGELGRSDNTVKIHRHRIMAKLKITSVASLANLYNHLRPD
jgi:FixJ family two-component response regulator